MNTANNLLSLKQKLLEAPILAFSVFKPPFRLYADTSNVTEKFRDYPWGSQVTAYTDNNPLMYLSRAWDTGKNNKTMTLPSKGWESM